MKDKYINSFKIDSKLGKTWIIHLICLIILVVMALIHIIVGWNDSVFICLFAVCIVLLFICLYNSIRNDMIMSSLNKRLANSEKLFRTILEQAPIGIAIEDDYYRISNVNPMFEKITGRSKKELEELKWTDITHPDDVQKDIEYMNKLIAGEIDGYCLDKRYIKPDGSEVWVHMVIAPIKLESREGLTHLCLIQDITKSMEAQRALNESERSKAVLLSHLPGMAYRCSYDSEWTMHFVSEGCFELTGYKPESILNNNELSFNDLIAPEYREMLRDEWKRALDLRISFKSQYVIIAADKKRKWVLELGQGIYNQNGEVEALEGIVIDITEYKMYQKKITYMMKHDFLTRLYNRQYIEKMKHSLIESELPLSVIIADINGLRLINDAFGLSKGDTLIVETARILTYCCRDTDIIARTGGDEFTIILPRTDDSTAYGIIKKIAHACETYNANLSKNNYNISLSMGYATMKTEKESIDDVFKVAEDYMYKRKLLNRQSSHNAILSSIMATLYERSQETEEHAVRIANLSKLIGIHLNLPHESIDELELFAMLHDVGKVGIDDSILNKPGKLNDEEWKIMQKHPEIGYRIAMSSTEFAHIAEYILSHHERWDGKGYPRGLKSEEIPLAARILAVADAFDAMTEDRIYRKALPTEKAIEEIRRNAGTQFDPRIVNIFIEGILKYKVNN